MKLSSDYLPMFSGYLSISRCGIQKERRESSDKRQMKFSNRQISPSSDEQAATLPDGANLASVWNRQLIVRRFGGIVRFDLGVDVAGAARRATCACSILKEEPMDIGFADLKTMKHTASSRVFSTGRPSLADWRQTSNPTIA